MLLLLAFIINKYKQILLKPTLCSLLYGSWLSRSRRILWKSHGGSEDCSDVPDSMIYDQCMYIARWLNQSSCRVISIAEFSSFVTSLFFFSFFSCNWMVWSQKEASKTCRSSMKAEWMVAIVEDCNLIINCIFIFKDPTSQYFDKIISNRIYNFYFFHRQANIVWFPIVALKIPS